MMLISLNHDWDDELIFCLSFHFSSFERSVCFDLCNVLWLWLLLNITILWSSHPVSPWSFDMCVCALEWFQVEKFLWFRLNSNPLENGQVQLKRIKIVLIRKINLFAHSNQFDECGKHFGNNTGLLVDGVRNHGQLADQIDRIDLARIF